MIWGVVGNDHDAAAGSETGAAELPEETEEGVALAVVLLAAAYEPASRAANRAEIPHALAGRRRPPHRAWEFRRNPPAAARTVLWKVYFVGGP